MTDVDRLVTEAFALDPGVRWVAVARPGEPPYWRYRSNVQPLNEAASDEAEERLANPAILALATARGDWDLDGLRYVAIAYGKLTQVIATLPDGAHISLSLEAGSPAMDVGEALNAFLRRGARPDDRDTTGATEFAKTVGRG